MMPETALPLVIFLIVLLALNRWARGDTEVAVVDDDAVAAWMFIATKVDEHVAALADDYLEAGGSESGDEPPDGFAHAIERFIATALSTEGAERCAVGAAIRCVVTLERERIYALVLSRVRDHLMSRRAPSDST
jgi:hypothetical protein